MTQLQLVAQNQQPDHIDHLIAKYGERVPRYTSYPTAPNFRSDISADTYASWLADLDAQFPSRPTFTSRSAAACAGTAAAT